MAGMSPLAPPGKKHVAILESAGLVNTKKVTSGMEGGMNESYAALDALLARMSC
jgi:hypothetical protein